VSARVASLKWTQPKYRRTPEGNDGPRSRLLEESLAEDFASATVEFETAEGQTLIAQK
jgi:hypothetical protein